MAMVRWTPFSELDKLFEEINQLQTKTSKDLAIDISQDDDNVFVEMQIPGIKPDKVDIVVEGDNLRIAGQREEEKEYEDRDYYAKEIRRGQFERTLHLPAAVMREKTRASMEDGVLKIVLPKAKQGESHKVKIEQH